jgi:hypothetical protein
LFHQVRRHGHEMESSTVASWESLPASRTVKLRIFTELLDKTFALSFQSIHDQTDTEAA